MNYEFFVFVKNIFSFTILTLLNSFFYPNNYNKYPVTMKPSIHQLLIDDLYNSNLTQHENISGKY